MATQVKFFLRRLRFFGLFWLSCTRPFGNTNPENTNIYVWNWNSCSIDNFQFLLIAFQDLLHRFLWQCGLWFFAWYFKQRGCWCVNRYQNVWPNLKLECLRLLITAFAFRIGVADLRWAANHNHLETVNNVSLNIMLTMKNCCHMSKQIKKAIAIHVTCNCLVERGQVFIRAYRFDDPPPTPSPPSSTSQTIDLAPAAQRMCTNPVWRKPAWFECLHQVFCTFHCSRDENNVSYPSPKKCETQIRANITRRAKTFLRKRGKNHFKNHDGNIRNMNSVFRFFLCNTPAPTVANGIRFYPNAQQGFPFHSGGWGLRVCSLDAAQPFATRSQPFATVRVRALWPCLWGLLQKNASTFRGFKRRVTSLRVAGVVVRVESNGGRLQIPWQGWYFMRCVENWRQPRMKHRFWGNKFWSSWKNSWENVDTVATQCENWRKTCT